MGHKEWRHEFESALLKMGTLSENNPYRAWIEKRLASDDFGRVVTGGELVGGASDSRPSRLVKSKHSAIDNCSWLSLSVDYDDLKENKSHAQLYFRRLEQCLEYTIIQYVKNLNFNPLCDTSSASCPPEPTYRGTHYFQNAFKDPYIQPSALQESSYHLEATMGLVLGLLKFADAHPDGSQADTFENEAKALWSGAQAFVRDHGFPYSSQRIQDLSTLLASSTAVIWFIDTHDHLNEKDHHLDQPLRHYGWPFDVKKAEAFLREGPWPDAPAWVVSGHLDERPFTLVEEQAVTILSQVARGETQKAQQNAVLLLNRALYPYTETVGGRESLEFPVVVDTASGEALHTFRDTGTQMLAWYAVGAALKANPSSDESGELQALFTDGVHRLGRRMLDSGPGMSKDGAPEEHIEKDGADQEGPQKPRRLRGLVLAGDAHGDTAHPMSKTVDNVLAYFTFDLASHTQPSSPAGTNATKWRSSLKERLIGLCFDENSGGPIEALYASGSAVPANSPRVYTLCALFFAHINETQKTLRVLDALSRRQSTDPLRFDSAPFLERLWTHGRSALDETVTALQESSVSETDQRLLSTLASLETLEAPLHRDLASTLGPILREKVLETQASSSPTLEESTDTLSSWRHFFVHAPSPRAWLDVIGEILARRSAGRFDPRQQELAMRKLDRLFRQPSGELSRVDRSIRYLGYDAGGLWGTPAGPLVWVKNPQDPNGFRGLGYERAQGQESGGSWSFGGMMVSLQQDVLALYRETLRAFFLSEYKKTRTDSFLNRLVLIRYALNQIEAQIPPAQWAESYPKAREIWMRRAHKEHLELCSSPYLGQDNGQEPSFEDTFGVSCHQASTLYQHLLSSHLGENETDLGLLIPQGDPSDWQRFFLDLRVRKLGRSGHAWAGQDDVKTCVTCTLTLTPLTPKSETPVAELQDAMRRNFIQRFDERLQSTFGDRTRFDWSHIDPIAAFHTASPRHWFESETQLRQALAMAHAIDFGIKGQAAPPPAFPLTPDRTTTVQHLRQFINAYAFGDLPALAKHADLAPSEIHRAMRTGQLTEQAFEAMATVSGLSDASRQEWSLRFHFTADDMARFVPGTTIAEDAAAESAFMAMLKNGFGLFESPGSPSSAVRDTSLSDHTHTVRPWDFLPVDGMEGVFVYHTRVALDEAHAEFELEVSFDEEHHLGVVVEPATAEGEASLLAQVQLRSEVHETDTHPTDTNQSRTAEHTLQASQAGQALAWSRQALAPSTHTIRFSGAEKTEGASEVWLVWARPSYATTRALFVSTTTPLSSTDETLFCQTLGDNIQVAAASLLPGHTPAAVQVESVDKNAVPGEGLHRLVLSENDRIGPYLATVSGHHCASYLAFGDLSERAGASGAFFLGDSQQAVLHVSGLSSALHQGIQVVGESGTLATVEPTDTPNTFSVVSQAPGLHAVRILLHDLDFPVPEDLTITVKTTETRRASTLGSWLIPSFLEPVLRQAQVRTTQLGLAGTIIKKGIEQGTKQSPVIGGAAGAAAGSGAMAYYLPPQGSMGEATIAVFVGQESSGLSPGFKDRGTYNIRELGLRSYLTDEQQLVEWVAAIEDFRIPGAPSMAPHAFEVHVAGDFVTVGARLERTSLTVIDVDGNLALNDADWTRIEENDPLFAFLIERAEAFENAGVDAEAYLRSIEAFILHLRSGITDGEGKQIGIRIHAEPRHGATSILEFVQSSAPSASESSPGFPIQPWGNGQNTPFSVFSSLWPSPPLNGIPGTSLPPSPRPDGIIGQAPTGHQTVFFPWLSNKVAFVENPRGTVQAFGNTGEDPSHNPNGAEEKVPENTHTNGNGNGNGKTDTVLLPPKTSAADVWRPVDGGAPPGLSDSGFANGNESEIFKTLQRAETRTVLGVLAEADRELTVEEIKKRSHESEATVIETLDELTKAKVIFERNGPIYTPNYLFLNTVATQLLVTFPPPSDVTVPLRSNAIESFVGDRQRQYQLLGDSMNRAMLEVLSDWPHLSGLELAKAVFSPELDADNDRVKGTEELFDWLEGGRQDDPAAADYPTVLDFFRRLHALKDAGLISSIEAGGGAWFSLTYEASFIALEFSAIFSQEQAVEQLKSYDKIFRLGRVTEEIVNHSLKDLALIADKQVREILVLFSSKAFVTPDYALERIPTLDSLDKAAELLTDLESHGLVRKTSNLGHARYDLNNGSFPALVKDLQTLFVGRVAQHTQNPEDKAFESRLLSRWQPVFTALGHEDRLPLLAFLAARDEAPIQVIKSAFTPREGLDKVLSSQLSVLTRQNLIENEEYEGVRYHSVNQELIGSFMADLMQLMKAARETYQTTQRASTNPRKAVILPGKKLPLEESPLSRHLPNTHGVTDGTEIFDENTMDRSGGLLYRTLIEAKLDEQLLSTEPLQVEWAKVFKNIIIEQRERIAPAFAIGVEGGEIDRETGLLGDHYNFSYWEIIYGYAATPPKYGPDGKMTNLPGGLMVEGVGPLENGKQGFYVKHFVGHAQPFVKLRDALASMSLEDDCKICSIPIGTTWAGQVQSKLLRMPKPVIPGLEDLEDEIRFKARTDPKGAFELALGKLGNTLVGGHYELKYVPVIRDVEEIGDEVLGMTYRYEFEAEASLVYLNSNWRFDRVALGRVLDGGPFEFVDEDGFEFSLHSYTNFLAEEYDREVRGMAKAEWNTDLELENFNPIDGYLKEILRDTEPSAIYSVKLASPSTVRIMRYARRDGGSDAPDNTRGNVDATILKQSGGHYDNQAKKGPGPIFEPIPEHRRWW